MKNLNLIAARTASGKTKKQVAIKSQIPYETYKTYEYGSRTPHIRAAIKIADALGVTDLRELWPRDDSQNTCNDKV